MHSTSNINILSLKPLITPQALIEVLPITKTIINHIINGRNSIINILSRQDPRLLVVVGPCSIHDEQAALEYAERLYKLSIELRDRLFLVMRVYFEKPRTDTGWKGFINDPQLDGSFDIESGLYRARQLLLKINDLGVSAATEMLDPISPQYTADLITWASIGARTIESPTHRQMSSGLSMPVGFKNSTGGDLHSAINAIKTARRPHSFLGIDQNGRTCIVQTKGNPYGHLILRGGRSGPNYAPEYLKCATDMLFENGLDRAVVVDCSHDNSGKIGRNQELVLKSVLSQRMQGNDSIIGIMLESNLYEGNQKLAEDPSLLRYGVSITDDCIGWDKTEELLRHAYEIISSHASHNGAEKV